MRVSVLPIAALALAGAIGMTGCGAVDASKSGRGTVPITVRLATGDATGRAASDGVETFAAEIEARSGGSIAVEILWESFLGENAGTPDAVNDFSGDSYAEVARQVQAGEVELAMVPDFAWVSRGASSVAALKVPFLIDSVALMKEVSQDQGLAALADLESLDVTPLALIPESIRHPVGFDHPLSTLGDFADRGIRVVDSAAAPIIEAWGARPLVLAGSFGAEVLAGEIRGADSAFVQSMTLPVSGVFTADVPYLAKFNTLVAAGPWWDSLSSRQRDIVAAAASATSDHALETTPDDDEAGRAYCERGGTVVHAGPANLDELRRAAQPVIDRLRDQPETRDIVASIEELKSDLPPAVVASECTPTPPPALQGDPDQTARFPEGSYRATLTTEDFTDRGVDLGEARNHDGVWTLTFRDGQVWDIGCSGSTYSVKDGRLSIVLGTTDRGCGSIPGGELFSARWSFDGSVLRFTDIGPGIRGPEGQTFAEVLWGSQGWVKVD